MVKKDVKKDIKKADLMKKKKVAVSKETETKNQPKNQ